MAATPRKRSVLAILLLLLASNQAGFASESKQIQTLPASRGGQDLLGTRFPDVHFDRWLNTPGNRVPDLGGCVTLYRWWTDTCPFCAKTLPAIEQLERDFGARGLKVVAVYHPKPPGDVADEPVLAAAKRLGWTGPIVIDSRWDVLRKIWLSTGERRATSVSFLVDAHGVIRFVHPGVQYFPSAEPADSRENSDYLLLRAAIDRLLPAAAATTRPAREALSETDAEEAVAEIPAVGQFLDAINRTAHGESHGLLFSQGHPADDAGVWQIYVGEDRDDAGAVHWHTFRVDARTGDVAIDAGKPGHWIPFDQWNSKERARPSAP